MRDAGTAANAAATASTNPEEATATASAPCSLAKLLDATARYLSKSVGAGLGAHVLVVTAHRADAAFNVPQSVFSVMRPPWLRVHVLHVTDASTGPAPAHSTLQVCCAPTPTLTKPLL